MKVCNICHCEDCKPSNHRIVIKGLAPVLKRKLVKLAKFDKGVTLSQFLRVELIKISNNKKDQD